MANRLNVLIYEIYLDAQYRERTCLRMHDLVIDLETRLENKEWELESKKNWGGSGKKN